MFLPRSGPDHDDIDRDAAAKLTPPHRKAGIDYVLIDINKAMLASFDRQTSTVPQTGFLSFGRGIPNIPVGIGDVVRVSIFEAQSGGLFIPSDAGSRPGNYITLPQQTIDRSGTISIPYAGRIEAAGKLKEGIEEDIEHKLASRAIEPQVILTTMSTRSNEAAVVGDVDNPRKVTIPPGGERILDAISEAGGLASPDIETSVTLQRRGKTATIAYASLLENPEHNIYLAPGDTISVEHERRTYIALGASGINSRIGFEDSDLTLGEAMAKAGGLLDGRADPGEVVVYRQVDRAILERLGIDLTRFSGATIPVIFRANLRDPATLFAIQQFRMADKDVIYVSNAKSVELAKFLNILNAVTSTASKTANDMVDARGAINGLSH
jgi:polysaccharide export outer membrane protein